MGFLCCPRAVSSERICLRAAAVAVLQTASAFACRWFIAWCFARKQLGTLSLSWVCCVLEIKYVEGIFFFFLLSKSQVEAGREINISVKTEWEELVG